MELSGGHGASKYLDVTALAEVLGRRHEEGFFFEAVDAALTVLVEVTLVVVVVRLTFLVGMVIVDGE